MWLPLYWANHRMGCNMRALAAGKRLAEDYIMLSSFETCDFCEHAGRVFLRGSLAFQFAMEAPPTPHVLSMSHRSGASIRSWPTCMPLLSRPQRSKWISKKVKPSCRPVKRNTASCRLRAVSQGCVYGEGFSFLLFLEGQDHPSLLCSLQKPVFYVACGPVVVDLC